MMKSAGIKWMALMLAVAWWLAAGAQPAAPQYDQADCWWSGANGNRTNDVDVFYVLPTCVGAWQDSCGVTHFNADVHNAKHRRAWELSCQLAQQIFGMNTNLYLPYYRQATFGTPSERAAEVRARLPTMCCGLSTTILNTTTVAETLCLQASRKAPACWWK